MDVRQSESKDGCCEGAGCSCSESASRKSKLKILIAVFILLAAVGIGAWSLASRTPATCNTSRCGDSTGACCPK